MRFYSDYYKNAYSKLYKEAYSKYYDEYYYNYYKQQNSNQRQGPDVNLDMSQVEWVCTNPKTKEKVNYFQKGYNEYLSLKNFYIHKNFFFFRLS